MTVKFGFCSLELPHLRRGLMFLALSVVAIAVWHTSPADAQSTRELASRLERLEQELQNLKGGDAGVDELSPQEAASVQVRVLKLEQLVEQLTGQIEETRYRVGQMSTELRQLSDDVNYRLAILEQALGVTGAVASAPPPAVPNTGQANSSPLVQRQPAASATPPVQAPNQQAAQLSGDEPLSQPVASQPRRSAPQTLSQAQIQAGPPENVTQDGQMILRTDESGQALAADPNVPAAPIVANEEPAIAPPPATAPNPGAVTSNQLASLPPPNRVPLPDGTPKEQYDYAFGFLTRNDFASAEVALRDFLSRHPDDPLAGNAQYWLGETYYVRGDYKQAAVEFMAGYQKYPKSNKGPDNLLKLGMSMASLGQTQGACTALSRLDKDYANAPDQIQKTAAAQRRDLKCR